MFVLLLLLLLLLKHKEKKTDRWRKSFHLLVDFLNATMARAAPGWSCKIQELNMSLPHGWQRPKYLSHYLLPLRVYIHRNGGTCGHPMWSLKCWATCPPFSSYSNPLIALYRTEHTLTCTLRLWSHRHNPRNKQQRIYLLIWWTCIQDYTCKIQLYEIVLFLEMAVKYEKMQKVHIKVLCSSFFFFF